jgi:hypothetical protein
VRCYVLLRCDDEISHATADEHAALACADAEPLHANRRAKAAVAIRATL